MPKFIAITIGDINGIGIHILIKAWKRGRIKNFILFTNINIFKKFIIKNNLKIRLNIINDNSKKINYVNDKLNIYTFKSHNLEDNTYKSLIFSYKSCIKKICIGLINLPMRKDLIKNNINKNFIGQTEFYQKIDNKKYSNMILFHKKIIISPLTTHIEVKKLSKMISNKQFLYNQILNLYNSLKDDFNFNKPKIIISGFNPHSGENGTIGQEEIKIIIPVIKKLKSNAIDIDGPVSADSMLIKKNLKNYDCFLFAYHDQALIPFKFISQFTGVNYTGNLNVIRTSPDHGTAYDLIGSKNISDKSLINCFKLIKRIYKNRIFNEKSQKIS